jgi:type I restriction enzyme S subunit
MQLPEGWVVQKFGDVLDIKNGRNQKAVESLDGQYPILGSAGNVMGYATDYICDEGTTIIGRKGNISTPIYITKKFWNVDTAFGLSAKGNLDKKYLYYYCLSYNFSGLNRGTTIPSLVKTDLLGIPIPLPPLKEQKRIVAILDEAFTGISQAITNTEKNLANARELFESYLNEVFATPKPHWTQTTLSDLCSIKHGFAFKSEYFSEQGNYILLTPGSFYEQGGFRERGEKTKYYNGEIPADFLLMQGDFLFAMTEQAVGLLGSSLIVPEDNKFLHNQRLGLAQPHEGIIWNNNFFHHQFNTTAFRASVQETASGVKVRHTSPSKLGAIKVSYPDSLLEQETVASRLNKLSTQSQNLATIYQQKLQSLAELKQSLLQKAFSGELTANNVDKWVNP